MQLIKSSFIPELDQLYPGSLVDLLEEWDSNDTGGLIQSILGGHVLEAYQGRRQHKDQGLYALPRFGDESIRNAVFETLSRPLIKGGFCIDLKRGILGYTTEMDEPSGRDMYRALNPLQTYSINGSAYDLAEVLVATHGFDLRLFTTKDQSRSIEFKEAIELSDFRY